MGSHLHQNFDRLSHGHLVILYIPGILHHEHFTLGRTFITRSTHSKAFGICSGMATTRTQTVFDQKLRGSQLRPLIFSAAGLRCKRNESMGEFSKPLCQTLHQDLDTEFSWDLPKQL